MTALKYFTLACLSAFLLCISTQSFSQTYDFGIVGDGGLWNVSTQTVHGSMLRNNVKTLIMPGDNWYSNPYSQNTYDEMWEPWRANEFRFDVVAIGNHSLGYEQEIQYFNMPAENYAKTYDNNIKFIVLNSDNENTVSEQMDFLDKELTNTTEPVVFLVYHHPTYTLSVFHNSLEKAEFQHSIRPIIWKHRGKITALLVGHDHISLIAHYNTLPVILSGSTHEQRPHVPLNYNTDSVKVRTNWSDHKNPMWAHLVVDSNARSAQVDFVRGADDQVVCSATFVTGSAAKFKKNCRE